MPGSAVLRRALHCGIAVAVVAFGPAAAIAQSSAEAQIKGAFVHNFLKFVEWPASAFSGPADSLIVGILGRGPSADAAATFLAGKQVNTRPVAVRRLADGQDVLKVHAIFIGGSDTRRSHQLIESLLGRGVLIIGESERFAQGGGSIGMILEDKRVRFDVNLEAATVAQLKISSKLLSLARHVLGESGEPRR